MKLDFATFVQILLLGVTAFLAFRNLLPEETIDFVGIIFLGAIVGLIIVYAVIASVDIRWVQRLKKADRLEREIRRLKELLDYRKMTESLNTRLRIIENKMNKKGVLSPQAVILIIIVILLIVYVLRELMYG